MSGQEILCIVCAGVCVGSVCAVRCVVGNLQASIRTLLNFYEEEDRLG